MKEQLVLEILQVIQTIEQIRQNRTISIDEYREIWQGFLELPEEKLKELHESILTIGINTLSIVNSNNRNADKQILKVVEKDDQDRSQKEASEALVF